ncbi:interferon-induced very large GTPase 1-like [Archocentrus centrarchus]|uniref:interferon-induced very large GTPase 1-like n=1 Tax=Archocentrus centrarchus TaxID=63155 RepID=UPI0011EA3CC9|nr:interferon-induced very large GTPase 1-like [Archocentrus centrarchus]
MEENSDDTAAGGAGEPETESVTKTKELPELTLVLLGDTNSIEIVPKNILLDHEDQTNVEQFSSKLYDFCGRHIAVINLLGLQNTDKILLNEGNHVFLLLLPYGQHNSQYSSAVQQLEKAFGEGILSYVMTVVTHEPGDKCESALTDLKTNSSFAEKRFHTCTRSMTDANEIIDLLEKIDAMVSENSLHSRHEEQREYLDHRCDKEKGIGNGNMSYAECESLNGPGVAEHSQKKDDSTGGKGGHKPVSAETEERGNISDVIGSNEKTLNISEDSNSQQFQREAEKLLRRLHLHDNYQQKMSTADFLKIGPPVKQSHDTSEKDLAYTFLQRLMMLDYRARDIPVRQDNPDVSCSQSVPVSDSDDFDDLFRDSADSDKSKESHVHPMDVQMAVFHCSDSFLKQNMVTKLSQCQYALPLLVPDLVTMDIECPLWTFRQITKTWKKTQIKDNSNVVTMKSMPICKAETSMVSFFRLGSLSVSKSQLMNSLINDRHSTFFHRNCKGSTKSRHLMDGVAEIAWYCPAGEPNDSFTDCIAFCNLHGDALLIEKQREILTEKSSINIVLVPTLEKGQKNTTVIQALYKSPKPLIILTADSDRGVVQVKDGKYKMGLKDRNQSDVSEELKGIIRKVLSGPHASFQLESMAKVSGIRVDEDDAVCLRGKSAAVQTVNMLQWMGVSKIKDKFLPCQGDLWLEWCKINKELYHLKGNIEKDKSQKEQQLMKIRQDQCKDSNSELMKSFTKRLLSLPPKEKEYFLKWTQILIDALSTDDLSSILQSYDKKWTEVLTLKKKHDKSALLTSKQTELEEISKKLQSATFGLEHIFREMGQIYEAHKAVKPKSRFTDWAKYPELAADLMISGHPVELMDGDAGQVPLTWISGILDEVIKKLGDQRVFVLSVLGLQSSGKSTMLNAMFGLQFAVSAGRCTKGAFMQLVKVSEELRKVFQFEYVLVVDTEGLRALELAGNATLHHDNELATFVVGLGNLTLINIFGENPADMQDVLQIVVQAFMRMKKVKLSPSCVFVHQNVTDIAATEQNMDGKRRLQEKLDQMAQLAAKEESCDAECFSDVIAFDVQKDVKYFAQLWEGSPPMAPPNPGYSKSIQELKNIILSKAKQSAGIKLSHFKIKIHNLWNALMNEQFVFSFKNTLEIAVYRRLEVQYGNWTWALRSNMLTIENHLHTRIENGNLDRVGHSDLFKRISKKYKEVQKNMTKYFEDDKEMLVQWKGRFENKIKEFQEELVRGVERKLDEVIQQKKTCKKLDEKKPEFENKLLQKSKELAHQLKDKAKDEDELKTQFNSVWSHWVKDLTADTQPIKDINLDDDQANILHDLGFEWGLIIESKNNGRYKMICQDGDYSNYVVLRKQQNTAGQNIVNQVVTLIVDAGKKVVNQFRGPLEYEDQELIRSLINDVEKQSLDEIRKKPVATRGYSSAYLQEVAQKVQVTVTEFEKYKKYAFKKEFTVNLLLYVFEWASSWLSQSHKTFAVKNDARTYLETKRTQYFNIFRSFCKGSSSAVVFGEMICGKLKVSTVEAVCNQTAIDLAGEMKCSYPVFNENRLNLEKHLLKSLAEKEDFDAFITYIQNPRKQVEAFIKENVNAFMSGEHKVKAMNILWKNVAKIKEVVHQALFNAVEEVKSQSGDIDMWAGRFSSFLNNKLTLDAISCQNFKDINNFDFLKEEIEKGLESITKEMKQLSLDKMNEFRLRPDQILIDQLCDCCWEKCPFCAAVCTNTIKDHVNKHKIDHSCPFHRSQAVNGWHYKYTEEMCVEFCTTKVASDGLFYPDGVSTELFFYKEYRKAGPRFADWSITPDKYRSKYWTWFVYRFQKDLENYYKLKFTMDREILEGWKADQDEAIQSLDEMYKL